MWHPQTVCQIDIHILQILLGAAALLFTSMADSLKQPKKLDKADEKNGAVLPGPTGAAQ